MPSTSLSHAPTVPAARRRLPDRSLKKPAHPSATPSASVAATATTPNRSAAPSDAARRTGTARRTNAGRDGEGTAGTRNGSDRAESAACISRSLARRIGVRRFDMWFDQATRFRVNGSRLCVDAASQYVADWIGRHFADDLAQVARQELGDAASVDLAVAPEAFGRRERADGDRSPGAEVAPKERGLAIDTGARNGHDGSRPSGRAREAGIRRMTLRKLDEFVAGPSNQLAFDAARRIAQADAAADASSAALLFVHGDCGVGKTHLLQGICERRRALNPRQQVRYTTAEQFTNEYLAALRKGALDGFRKSLRRVDLLAIDDIHFLSNKTATQSEFLHTMDAIDLGGAKLVLASDEHPRQIRRFSQSLVSRFLSGMVVRIERPDRETRLRLVRRLASARGMQLQPAALELVANRCVASVREIEGALARVAAVAALATDMGGENGEIGSLIAERAFDEGPPRVHGPVRIADILERVCARMGVERDDVLGSSRHRRVTLARGLVVHLARELTTQSFPEIARALGRDTHSTAHTAARRVEEMVAAQARVEFADAAIAASDGTVPLGEVVAQLRHDIVRGARPDRGG